MQGTDMAELPRIIYEGIDASDQNERFESMLLLPGEKVRLDEKKTVSGVATTASAAATTSSSPNTRSKAWRGVTARHPSRGRRATSMPSAC
jgi:hypothetical protein